jgi:hypothetical protein
MTAAAKKIRQISDLVADDRNANKGTARGRGVIAQSLKDNGTGRSILIDRKGRIIAGNKTVENAGAIGLKDLLVVRSDGSKLIAVQRTDLDLKRDGRAKALAIADNRAAELNLDWDGAVLAELGQEIDLTPFFSAKELGKAIGGVDSAAPGDKALNHGYAVMIEGLAEDQQLLLLERLSGEGFTCRALTF